MEVVKPGLENHNLQAKSSFQVICVWYFNLRIILIFLRDNNNNMQKQLTACGPHSVKSLLSRLLHLF